MAALPVVVADSLSRLPLPGAPVYDRKGTLIGLSDDYGHLPELSADDFPVKLRYMGFKDKFAGSDEGDTIFMSDNAILLRELVVDSKQRKLLHMIAYVREFSTLSSYADTVFLFREKMVDYMLAPDEKMRFKGWRQPRVLTSKSYYRFTNFWGLDSVSDRCNHHFSWTDWAGIAPDVTLPAPFLEGEKKFVRRGKYSPAETWNLGDGCVNVEIDALADSAARKWVPGLAFFFRDDVDFQRLRVNYDYDYVAGETLTALDLNGYSVDIESTGRGHCMFMFNRANVPFSVTSRADITILSKDFVTQKEARKWEKLKLDEASFAIYEPADAPELEPAVLSLIARVNAIDHESTRLDFVADRRLAGRRNIKVNAGKLVLRRFKEMFGIDNIAANIKWQKQWRNFRRMQVKLNRAMADSVPARW